MKYKHRIMELYTAGKTRQEIMETLGVSASLLCYHLSPGQKRKTYLRITKQNLERHPLFLKWQKFKHKISRPKINRGDPRNALYHKVRDFFRDRKTHKMNSDYNYTVDDILTKFGDNPKCYLTGKPIDLLQPKTYALDHILPASRGGDNSLENMGLCTKAVNMAKHNLTVDEFYDLCRSVVENRTPGR